VHEVQLLFDDILLLLAGLRITDGREDGWGGLGGVVSFDVLLGFFPRRQQWFYTHQVRAGICFCFFVYSIFLSLGFWVLGFDPPLCSEKGTMLFLASSC
jgi:hypothetical protein